MYRALEKGKHNRKSAIFRRRPYETLGGTERHAIAASAASVCR
jgi:hypothetical protein